MDCKANNIDLWSSEKFVIESGLLNRMDKKEIELQERWFEIYKSEISYYKSLKILDEIIMKNFESNLKIQDFNLIFINHIKGIIQCSKE